MMSPSPISSRHARLRLACSYLVWAAGCVLAACGEPTPAPPGAREETDAPGQRRFFRPGYLHIPPAEPQQVGPQDCVPEFSTLGRCWPMSFHCSPDEVIRLDQGCLAVGPPHRPMCLGSDGAPVEPPRDQGDCRFVAPPPSTERLADGTRVGPDCAEIFTGNTGCRPDPAACGPEHIATPRSGCLPLDVPEGCDFAAFCHVEQQPGDVYVDPEAPEGGDGSRARPVRRLSEALRRVDGDKRVVLAAGDYTGTLLLSKSMTIEGVGPSRVRLRPDAPSVSVVTLPPTQGRVEVTLRGLTLGPSPDPVRPGPAVAVWNPRGMVTLERVRIEGVAVGLWVEAGAAQVDRALFTDGRLGDTGLGQAVLLKDGATVTIERSAFDEAGRGAVFTLDETSSLTLNDVFVRGVLPASPGEPAVVVRSAGGRVNIEQTIFEAEGPGVAIALDRPPEADEHSNPCGVEDDSLDLTLVASVIRGPVALGDDRGLLGIHLVRGRGRVERSAITGMWGMGIGALDATLCLDRALVADVHVSVGGAHASPVLPDDPARSMGVGGSGVGVFAQSVDGLGALRVEGSTLNRVGLVAVLTGGMPLDVVDSTIAATGRPPLAPDDVTGLAHGIIFAGPRLLIDRTSIVDGGGQALRAVGREVTVTGSLIADHTPNAVSTADGLSHGSVIAADRLTFTRNLILRNRGGSASLLSLGALGAVDAEAGPLIEAMALGASPDETPKALVTANVIARNECTGFMTLTIDTLFESDVEHNMLRDNCGPMAIAIMPFSEDQQDLFTAPRLARATRMRGNVVAGQRQPSWSTGGGFGIGCLAGARCTLDSDMLVGTQQAGVLALGTGTSAHLHRVLVEGTRPMRQELEGYGVFAAWGAEVEVHESLLLDNHTAGAAALAGATLSVVRSQIGGTGWGFYEFVSDDDTVTWGYTAAGILAIGGSLERIEGVELAANDQVGIMTDLGTVDVESAWVTGSNYCAMSIDSPSSSTYQPSELWCVDNGSNRWVTDDASPLPRPRYPPGERTPAPPHL